MRKRRRKKRKREMTRANERKSQKSLSSFEKNSFRLEFQSDSTSLSVSVKKWEKGEKKKNKKPVDKN